MKRRPFDNDTDLLLRGLVRDYVELYAPPELPLLDVVWERAMARAAEPSGGTPQPAIGLPATAEERSESVVVYAALAAVFAARRLMTQAAATEQDVADEFMEIASRLEAPRSLAEHLSTEIGPALLAIVREGGDHGGTSSAGRASRISSESMATGAQLWIIDSLTPAMVANGKTRPGRSVRPRSVIDAMPESAAAHYQLYLDEGDDDGLRLAPAGQDTPVRIPWTAFRGQRGLLLRLVLEALGAGSYSLTVKMLRKAIWPDQTKIEDPENRVRSIKAQLNTALQNRLDDLVGDHYTLAARIPYCWIRSAAGRQRLPRPPQAPA